MQKDEGNTHAETYNLCVEHLSSLIHAILSINQCDLRKIVMLEWKCCVLLSLYLCTCDVGRALSEIHSLNIRIYGIWCLAGADCTPKQMSIGKGKQCIKRSISGFYEQISDHSNENQSELKNLLFKKQHAENNTVISFDHFQVLLTEDWS